MLLDQDGLLAADSVAGYLNGRGLAADGDVRSLGGGVSNVVLAVGERYVVKQSLPKLRVASEWLAKRERAVTEARALRYAAAVTPGAVPEVYDVDEELCTLTIAAAPAGWRCWKDDLLAGLAEPATGARLGELLATWHARSAADADVLASFDDGEAFDQLRVDPYFRTLAQRRPEIADAVNATTAAMLGRRLALVHGDFSPKNVLLGEDGLWVIDFEVAHLGDPSFDVAFLLTHLLLKSVHVPDAQARYREVAAAFLATYAAQASPLLAAPAGHLGSLVACLLLARVDGKSPAEYLDEDGRVATRALGDALLGTPVVTAPELWALL